MISYDQGKKFANEVFVLMTTTFDDFSTAELVEYLKAADDLYGNDEESFLEDNQYDALYQYTQAAEPSHPYFTSVGSEVRGGKVVLPFQMGSLDQVMVGEWNQHVVDLDLSDELLVITDKEDGGSDLIRYTKGNLQIAYSRGDGTRGADITRHIKRMPSVPKDLDRNIDLSVRCEHIISRENFRKLFEMGARRRGGAPYKNPRNMVSGLMNSSENNPKFYQYIDVIAYEIVGSKLPKVEQLELLEELGFTVVPYTTMLGKHLTESKLSAYLETRRNNSDFEIDGLVVEANSAAVRKRLDKPGSLNPGYAFKFKVADQANFAIATVKEVEWNISKDGYYKPRVITEPVDLVGVTVRHFTGFNAKFIKDNLIGPGAKIRVTRSGDVIPFILGVEVPAEEADMPDDDFALWTATGVDLMCGDVKDNATVKFEQLNDFFGSIDVPHLGEGNLKMMFEAGFQTPESIITLSQEDISQLIGSRSIGKKIFTSMREKFTNVPLYKLMGSHPAFGRGVGVRKMKKLYDAWDGDMTKCKSAEHITSVAGFQTKTAKKIEAGYSEFLSFLASVSGFITIEPFKAKKQGKLTGKTFVFTGFRNPGLEKQIIDQGGAMGTTVSSKTSYLVTAEENSTSTKAKAARDKGVAVIGLEELKKML